MKPQIIIKIAFKNLMKHRLRSILTIAGVTIGIASIIFLVSLGYGLEQLVTNSVANFQEFTILDVPSANISTLKINEQSIEKIGSFGHIESISAATNLAGRIRKSDSASAAETVIVGAKENYWKLANITVEKGQLPVVPDEIVLNRSVLSLLGEDANSVIGKSVMLDLIIPINLQEDAAGSIKTVESVPLKVTGIYSDDQAPVVFVTSSLLVKNGTTNFSSLKVKVDNQANVAGLRKQLENIGYSTEYVGDTVSEISRVFSLLRIILFAFGFVALIVAALGTFNTLTISLLERIKEIGLFKALGMRNRDVYKLFLTESLVIGFAGGLFGLVIGWLTGVAINIILSFLAHKSNTDAIQIFITPWFFALAVALFSILVGFLTGWYPSKRAVKIDPLDALKYE